MSTAHVALEPVVIAAKGLEFSAVLAGPASRELVMLLHGFPEGSYSQRYQVDALAGEGLRVLAPDLRGYGLSLKPGHVSAYAIPELANDVLAMAASLGHERVNLVSHDWGAALTWYLAQELPERVRRGVVINGPHPGCCRTRCCTRRNSSKGRTWVSFSCRSNGFAMLRQVLRASAREGTFTEQDLDCYQAGWEVEGVLTAMLNWYRALMRSPHRIAASAIEVPMCVLWGDKDAALDAALAEAGAALCESVGVHHFPHAAHWLNEEEPQAVNAILREVLAGR